MGLAEIQQERDAIEEQQAALETRDRHLELSMIAHLRGVAISDVSECHSYQYNQELHTAVKRRQTLHEDELLAADELGRQISKLRDEKENLLDTVWLASSPKQIKELWTKVAELLDDNQTQLQRDALAIEPTED